MKMLKLLKRKSKTEEEKKRELISELASEQLKKIATIGLGFPVIAYKI